jgi:hypothetical protein
MIVLEDVAAGAGHDRFDDAVLLAAGEHQHARGGREQAELGDRLDSGDPRQPQVHEHDVRVQVDHELDRVLAGGGLAGEFEPAG